MFNFFVVVHFRERGRMRVRERNVSERNIMGCLLHAHPLLGNQPTTHACALTGNPTSDLSVHGWKLNHRATPAGHILGI